MQAAVVRQRLRRWASVGVVSGVESPVRRVDGPGRRPVLPVALGGYPVFRISRRVIWQVLGDILLMNMAAVFALALRYMPAPIPTDDWRFYAHHAVLLTLFRLLIFWRLNLYKIYWRYVGVRDLLAVAQGVTLSSVVFFVPLMLSNQFSFPRAVVVMEWLLVILGVGGLRLSLRVGSAVRSGLRAERGTLKRLLIVGAGDHAEALAREVGRHADLNYRLVGFVDDDPAKQGTVIHGRPVLGPVDRIAGIVAQKRIEQVIIAVPSASGPEIRRLISLCESLPVRLLITPGFKALVGQHENGEPSVREVAPEDLLRRPPVRLSLKEIAGYLGGEVVLITGAGGSIGSELVRQVARVHPRRILLLGRGENSIFEIEQEATATLDVEVVPIIADIRDQDRMRQVFERFGPTVVFHAAAHKHVPLMEQYPEEAIKNNVGGTRNLVRLASRYRVKRFVLISSDKAVNPVNVMGATKRIAELLLQTEALGAPETRFMAVRFGNVLGSRGSVVQTMCRQIRRREPVTVTDPRMERFFMTIPEAVQLVIQAGALGRSGEVFLLDMGQPVNILELARDLIRLSGFVPYRDIPIRITGTRPGERLYEEILTQEEGVAVTRHERIFVAPATPLEPARIREVVEALLVAAQREDRSRMLILLQELLPTYAPSAFFADLAASEPGVAGEETLEAGPTQGLPPLPAHVPRLGAQRRTA
jgi:FlaA1/EpsC-like NDP-sugar epimerase